MNLTTWKMPRGQSEKLKEEMALALDFYKRKEWDRAFYRLERVHILSQPYVIAHTRSHWWMFKVGYHRGDAKEMLGQTFRIVASLVVSRIWVPLGNTGGANVSPVRPMPVPEDLEPYLQ
tara:strand:+ start:190 stop:546 length:357 start_codon:yes stop_codon:yes gene_type:complete